jgi:RND family efflux transporter MFP subunit
VSIQPQVSGRITKIHFVDGANLKVGDLLFTIDPRPYQAQLNQAEANLAQAAAAVNLAKVNFERVETVNDPRAVSRQDYDTKKNAVETAQATLQQNRAAVEMARLNLNTAQFDRRSTVALGSEAPMSGMWFLRITDHFW